MLRNIINTLITKFSSAVLGFLTIILVSQILGSQGKGEQALIVYNIYLLLLLFTLLGNSTLIYLTPRKHNGSLLYVSIVWILAMAVLSALIFVCIPQIATEYIFVSIAIGVFAALSEVNQFILLGKQEIKKANNVKLIYPLVSLGYIFVLNLFSLFDSVTDCVIGMAVAYLLSTILGIYYLKDDYKTLNTENTKEKLALSKLLFKLGATKQAGSIAQSMNYRLSFYIIGFYCGESLVGIYSNGISISEAIMLFGTSLALVQYSHLSNNENKTQSKRLTWKMSLINGLFTLLAVLFFALIPTDVYCFVFGEQFGEVRDVIRMLGFGIVLLSTASNFTQYLYARGNFKTTTIASFVGLAATLILGFTLIPRYGIMGATITASLSYTISFAIEFIVFLKSK